MSQDKPAPADIPELTPDVRKRIALEERLKNLSVPMKLRPAVWTIVSVALGVTGIAAVLVITNGDMKSDWWIVAIAFPATCAYLAVMPLGMSFARSRMRAQVERELATTIALRRSEELQDRLQEDFFTNLVKINFKYIDQYYLQTQLQADKSFVLCAVSASVSLLVIIGGIVLMYVASSTVQPGYVATFAGVLGEFIAAVFFYLYNRTITKMAEYHQKLVLTQNVSLALKITESLPPDRQADTRVKLVEYLSKDINLLLAGKLEEPNAAPSKE